MGAISAFAGRVVGLVMVLLAGLLPGADTAAVEPAGFTVLQINICNSGASCTLPGTVRHAAELIAARRPSVVTVNEICASDLAAIESLSGYAGAFTQSGDQTCTDAAEGNAGSPYGNALLFPAGIAVSGYRAVEYGEQNQRIERRTLTCASGDGVTACVTHLTCNRRSSALHADDRRIRAGQAAEMRAIVAEQARGGPTVLGGDWNLTASDADAYVPAGMVRAGDGAVQHVAVSASDFGDARATVLALDWTDHPALEVRYTVSTPRSLPAWRR